MMIKKNDFFVRESQVCNYIGIVESGSLFSFFEDEHANTIVSELYSTHSIITSYRSFLTGIPSPAHIQAYSPSSLYVIEKKEYEKLASDIKWMHVFKSIADQLFVNKCFKETSLVKLKAKERYEELIKYRKNIEQEFPQHLIASYLKMRPETLSRLKSLDLRQGEV
ncbi:Crp/Fnr family transcriptional regulator [Rapidithrix thailandica]|uniref:Crp/Fnr family transcriptional regulator n=1 Tax=Rapidithrix thailandica TaxID=413964 RepID=A0AAW9RYB6_9BACT